jgi:Spy/CpxP family protein refolding chaperone
MKTKFAYLLMLGVAVLGISLLAGNALAQQPPPPHGPPSPEERLKRLTTDLGLSEAQVAKLKPLFANIAEKMKALHDDTATPQEQKREKGREIMREADPAINAELTSDQKTKFEELRKKHKADGPPPAGPGGPNGGERKGPPPGGGKPTQ